ncbi:MAG: hypothetical protein D6808_02475, partial [Candidatus Dadabacteria bacterium]
PHSQKEDPTHVVDSSPIKRIAVAVCPSRDLAYAISLAKHMGIETLTADFGHIASGDILKSASHWVDLSDSETIWR